MFPVVSVDLIYKHAPWSSIRLLLEDRGKTFRGFWIQLMSSKSSLYVCHCSHISCFKLTSQSNLSRHKICINMLPLITSGVINPSGSNIDAIIDKMLRFVTTSLLLINDVKNLKWSVAGSYSTPNVLIVLFSSKFMIVLVTSVSRNPSSNDGWFRGPFS